MTPLAPPPMAAEATSAIPGTRRDFVSVQEIAESTGLHVAVVRRAIARGELRAHKLCSRLRVRRHDFEAWLEHSRVKPWEPGQ